MSLNRPPSAAERVASRGGPPSSRLQLNCLILGLVSGGALGWVLAVATTTGSPAWVGVVIPAGGVLFVLLLAVVAWSVNASIGGHDAPRLRPGVFVAAVVLAMSAVAHQWLDDGLSALRWQIPLIVGILFLVLAGLAAVRRAAVQGRQAAQRSQRHVQGTVTDDGLAEFESTPNPKLAHVTISFRDTGGQERWVTSLAKQLPVKPLGVGDRVDVWFDPDAPGDLSKILVEGDNGTSRIIPGRLR